MDVTPETISSYVDGELSAEEAAVVAKALETDPALRETLDEMRLVAGLTGVSVSKRDGGLPLEPLEPISTELRERLHALRPVPTLSSFEPVRLKVLPKRRVLRFAAIAATLLVAFGVLQMSTGAEVVLEDFRRLTAGADALPVMSRVRMHAGDTIRTGENERVQFRLPDGSEVILLPGTSVQLGDPAESVLGDLERGALLVTAYQRGHQRALGAGGYAVYARSATFGVRVVNGGAKLAGFGALEGVASEVTVTVGRGSLQIDHGGQKRNVAAGQRVVLRRGREPEWSRAWQDELFVPLLRAFRSYGTELMLGYFDSQPDVVSIGSSRWLGDARERELTLSDGPARYLALRVRMRPGHEPSALRLTLVRPSGPGKAVTSTIRTRRVGPEWTVVAVPLDAFDGPEADKDTREIPRSRSRFARIELAPVAAGAEFELKASLWAARPPLTGGPEDVR
ncbi:MAG: FecR domain-containing protein [Planctomycetota bacterium]